MLQSSAFYFKNQYLCFFWRSVTSCFRLFPHPSVSSIFPSITRFRRQFQSNVSHPVSHLSLHCMWDVPFLHDCIIPLSFSFDPSKWSSPSFCSSKFQNFQVISDLLFEVSMLQRHNQLCYICSTSPYCSLNISTICWRRRVFFMVNAFCMIAEPIASVYPYNPNRLVVEM